MKRIVLWAAVVGLAAAAWGTDFVLAPPPGDGFTAESPSYDATLELAWDDGRPIWLMTWRSGAGSWVGNDFDTSTIPGFRWIDTIKIMSTAIWPNSRWDGFRLGVFAFSGGVPGSRLYGPKFVMGSGGGFRWCEFDVRWRVSPGSAYVAAMEQYYDYPNNDPYILDGNRVFQGHSWQCQGGKWERLVGYWDYRNLMLRVIVGDLIGMTPTSIGRVKALYY